MHEFSIAVNVIDIIEENTQKANAEIVNKVDIEVGQFSGVVIDALDFALQQAKQKSVAENAIFNIIDIKGKLKCTECNHEYLADFLYTPCPKCKSYLTEVVQGNELKVKSIEVD